MLLHDPFAGHRDWDTGEPLLPADKCYWTSWDYVLADAIALIQDHTDDRGHLVWERDDPRVEVVATKYIDKAQAAIDKKTRGTAKKPYEPAPGENWRTHLRLFPGETEWPTMEEYYERENARLGISPENPDQVE